MNNKPRTTTEGLPMITGIVAAVLMLIQVLLQWNWTGAYSSLTALGDLSAFAHVSALIGYIIYPGIFLILLLVGLKTPRRSNTFGIVWTIISSLSVLSHLSSIAQYSNTDFITNTLKVDSIPAQVTIGNIIGLLGCILLLVSCITFLNKLKKASMNMVQQ